MCALDITYIHNEHALIQHAWRVGQGGSRDRDETRKAPEDASRTLRRDVQFICVFDPKCHEMNKNFWGAYP